MTSPPHQSGLSHTTIAALRARALQAAEHAYAPYSKFRVGAALLLDGLNSINEETIITGCNVENASYRLTSCAEQTAIVSAVALHGPKLRIRAIAIANLNQAQSAPCGACRQTILEFSTTDTWVFLPGEDGTHRDASLADLLPLAFRLQALSL